MKKITFLLILFISTLSFSQRTKSEKIGQTSLEELQMTVYDKDSTAAAVVLFDHGNLFFYNNNLNETWTDYYFRIKILKTEGSRKAIIKIPYYDKQEIKNIKGVTYNISNQITQTTDLQDKNILSKELSSNWKEISFTLPNVKAGSVIEYSYTLINPYELNMNDWYFQDDIPKIKSQYNSSIVGNFKYNIKLNGYFPLDINKGEIKKGCVKYSGDGYTEHSVDCAVQEFVMKDVPAYIEEKYTTSKEDNISRLSFRLETIEYSSGKKDDFTSSWKATDKKFKSGLFFGSEIKKSSFFKKNLPENIINQTNQLDKAKQVYYFIQNHYTLNNKGYNFQKINTKRAFENRTGTIPEINISLYNSLKAANIKAYIVMSSTRENGRPTQLFPVITDFNYLLIKTVINGKDYFLDASKKDLTFGLTPYYTLNGKARVLDFKKESYWQEISQSTNSSTKAMMNIKLEENGIVKNKLRVIKTGHDALNTRSRINKFSKDDYLDVFSTDKITLNNYSNKGKNFKENQLIENLDFTVNNSSSNSIQLQLFYLDRYISNPFKLDNRFYPVNFGHAFSYNYRANILLPNNYKIVSIPESKAFSLPNNGGKLVLNCKSIGNKIVVIFQFKFNKAMYSNEEYFALKEYFNQIVKAQSTIITLEKI
ncbi:hypothetical protein KCTC32516_01923 [Polaribacter huanghezhanensis]|uniref:DUF3857 domain-containing protein n=1 Tax=Polaribacter huanghezhanensis TaxID=1354726 RepID=UPI0026494F3D|nr:DUF3857 domain-containing protein [Polaribacter huanghezhanensis]WKD86547.1 hypothetical protein KCTC32516_01923 [Polaribacter huanghezhanensis]